MSLRRFQLLRRLPTPAPEETWSARMLWPDGHCREVAVTLLPPRRGGLAAARERARRLGWLGVRAIPALVDVVGLAGRVAAVVDHADGVDLQRLLARGPLPQRVGLELLAGVAGALGAAWERAPFAGEPPLREAHGALDPSRVWVDPSGRLRVTGFAALRLDAAEVDPTLDRAALAAMIGAVQGERPLDAAVDAALAGLAEDGSDLLDIAGLLRRAAWASEGASLAEWAEREVRPEPATATGGTWVEEPLDEADPDPQLLDLPPDFGPPPPLVFARPSVADDTSLDEFGGPRPRRRTAYPGASTFGPPPGTSSPTIPRPAPLRLGAGSGQAVRAAPRNPVPLALRAPARRGRASPLGGAGLSPIDAPLPAAVARPLPVRVGGDGAEPGNPRPPEATPSDPTPGAVLPAARRTLPGEGESTAPHPATWLRDHDPPTSPTDPLNDRPPPAADLRAVLADDPEPKLGAVAEAPPEAELSLELDPPSATSVLAPASARLRPLPVAAAPEEPERSLSLELDEVSRSLSLELDEVSVSLALEDTSHSDRVAAPPPGGAEEGTEELSTSLPVHDPAGVEAAEPVPETGDRPTQAIPDHADIEPTVRMAVTPSPTGFLAARLAAAVDEVSVPRAAEARAEPTLDVDPSVPRDLATGASPAEPASDAPASAVPSLFDAPTAEFVVQAEPPAVDSPTPGRARRPVEVRPVPIPPVGPVAPAATPEVLVDPAVDPRPPATPPRPRLQPIPPPSAVPAFLKGALSVLGILAVLGGAVLAWHWALAPLLRPVEVGGP